MRDIDRLISRTLRTEAEGFAPSDLASAEQRFLRSRRKRRFTWFGGATLATAAAIVAVAVFPRPDLANENRMDAAAPQMTTVSVGQEPVSISATGDAIWVANSGDGTVSRIDPETAEVVATIEVGGSPEELATDRSSGRSAVWVFDAEARRIVEVQPTTDTVGFHYTGEWPEGTHLDMAVKDETVWMADPATRTVHVDHRGQPPRNRPAYLGPKGLFKRGLLPERGGDVALEDGAGEVWAYNGAAGTLSLLQAADGSFPSAQRPEVTEVLTSESGDLAVGGEALWVSDDFGVIMRVDRQTFEKDFIDVGGRYSDLSFGGGYLWALTANDTDDGTATLRKIKPTDGSVVGEPISLTNEPVDVAAGTDAVWVAHQDGASVTRIETSPDPQPIPSDLSDRPVDEPTPADGAQIYFAFTANDDVYLEYSDGTTRQLTRTPDIERNAVFGTVSVFFERHDHETDSVAIIEHNFVTGEDSMVAEGREPAVSYGGDLAYVDGEAGNESLYLAPMENNGRLAPDHASVPLGSRGFSEPGSLEWSDDGKTLYFQARDDDWVTVELPVDNGAPGAPSVLDVVTDQPAGTTFVQPDNASVEAVEVGALCCRESEAEAFSRLSIGKLVSDQRGTRYEELVPDVLQQADLDPAQVYVADMHELTRESDGWEMFSGTRSWIVVADPMHVLLVDETGEVLVLAGAESGPSLLGVPPNARFGSFDLSPSVEGDLPG